MDWSDHVEERHDFSPSELDPSRRGAGPGDEPTGADEDLFARLQSITMTRRFEGAPALQRALGDDRFFTHLLQLIEPADWLLADTSRVDDDGVPRRHPWCERFSFRDPESLRHLLDDWWRRGPLYVDHPRRRAVVQPAPARVANIPPEEVARVAAAIAAYGAKQLPWEEAHAIVDAWTGRGEIPSRAVAGQWLAALTGPVARPPVSADDDLDAVLAAVESRWATLLAPLVQAVFGDDRFVARVAERFYAHHWFAAAAPMHFDDPAAAEAILVAWWRRFGGRHRAELGKVLPVDSLLADALAESRSNANPASTLQDPALLYLRDDLATVRAALAQLATDHAAATSAEVAYFLHRFGLDVDGLFALVVNRCDASWPPALVEVLAAALRVRSPRVVRHLAPLIRRKGARPLIEAYLLGEGANVIDGLLDLIGAGAKPRAFALEWLPRIAADDRGRATLATLAAAKDAKVRGLVAPLLEGLATT